MYFRRKIIFAALSSLFGLSSPSAFAGAATADWRNSRPDAIVDLRSAQGAELVKGVWRFHDADIVEVDHHAPGADLKATGAPNRTHNLSPLASAADFDDSAWEKIPADTLEARRGNGRLSFVWYRINLTIPERIADFTTAGSTAIFEVVLDDYAEITVNGKQQQVLGQSGTGLASGWNTPSRVVLSRDVKPGDRFQIAILGANAPLSNPPANFIWMRSATVQLFSQDHYQTFEQVPLEVTRLDARLDQIIAKDTKLEKLADGFGFTEGPVWVSAKNDTLGVNHDGFLLFSDPNNNRIYRWTNDGDLSVFRANSGYTGADIAQFRQPGSNGLAIDPQGRLTLCEHGNRRITRLEKNGTLTVLADRFEGKRLNSPNDLVYRSDGALYFTDPPFGLPKFHDDPRRELPVTGVFCLKDGQLKLVSSDFKGPNGLAFSPDEKYLYVDNWDDHAKIVKRYEVGADGTLSNGVIFADLTSKPGVEALDGLKVDPAGNVYVSGPGGLWIFAADGAALGTLRGPQLAANFAWGDSDRRSLYMTARTGLYRLRLKTLKADEMMSRAPE